MFSVKINKRSFEPFCVWSKTRYDWQESHTEPAAWKIIALFVRFGACILSRSRGISFKSERGPSLRLNGHAVWIGLDVFFRWGWGLPVQFPPSCVAHVQSIFWVAFIAFVNKEKTEPSSSCNQYSQIKAVRSFKKKKKKNCVCLFYLSVCVWETVLKIVLNVSLCMYGLVYKTYLQAK